MVDSKFSFETSLNQLQMYFTEQQSTIIDLWRIRYQLYHAAREMFEQDVSSAWRFKKAISDFFETEALVNAVLEKTSEKIMAEDEKLLSDNVREVSQHSAMIALADFRHCLKETFERVRETEQQVGRITAAAKK